MSPFLNLTDGNHLISNLQTRKALMYMLYFECSYGTYRMKLTVVHLQWGAPVVSAILQDETLDPSTWKMLSMDSMDNIKHLP